MYSLVYLILYVFVVAGSFGACHADIDVNRIHQLSRTDSEERKYNTQVRRSLKDNLITRAHDYDNNSSGYTQLRPPHFIPTSQTTTDDQKEITLKVHQSREDPKLFYQSESYLKEINGQNIVHEVASIYPGREVIRAMESHPIPKNYLRSGKQKHISSSSTMCIKCPHDRTLIAKKGVDRVVLQAPKLTTCSGRRAPSNIHFLRMYGSKFGTLLQQGSHVIVGRIMHKNKTLQLCKMQVHVIIQSCSTPKYLISHCDDTRTCNFTCRAKTQELDGINQLICGDNLKWQGTLPTCRARNWCFPPPPADNGRISCKSASTWQSLGLTEGSRCRVRCSLGWRWDRAVTVCRRGSWTNTLKCIPKINTIN